MLNFLLLKTIKFSDATEGTEFDTLEFSLKVKCTANKAQPKDSYRTEDLYENHSSKFCLEYIIIWNLNIKLVLKDMIYIFEIITYCVSERSLCNHMR